MANPLNLALSEGINTKIEKVPVELVELGELEEMSLAEVQKAKNQLSARRKRLQLQIDNRKLGHVSKIMDSLDIVLDRLLEGYNKDEVSAVEMKNLSSAYSEMLRNLNTMTSRIDSLDGGGRATKLSIEVKYKEE